MKFELLKAHDIGGKITDCIGYDCTCGQWIVREYEDIKTRKMAICEKCTSMKAFRPIELTQLQKMVDRNCND